MFFAMQSYLLQIPEGDWFCQSCVEKHEAGLEERRKDFVMAGMYANSPWNLNNLPLYPGSVLHYIGGSVTGIITQPWMYMGMVFSSFYWCVD